MRKPTRSKIARETAIISSLAIYHVWGSWLVYKPSEVGERMFSTISFGILATLGILAGEKILRVLVELKWGNSPNKEPTQ